MKIILQKLTSRGALAAILVLLILLFLFFVYAVSRDAEIIRSKDGVVRIIPKGSGRIERLEKLLLQSVSKDEYGKLKACYELLEKELQIASGRVKRLLVAAGADLSKGEDQAIRRLETLAARLKTAEHDMSVSLSVIGVSVGSGRTINTNSRHMYETMRSLYMDIQKLLTCIGVYNDEIDGDQAATCRAVKQFQKDYGLKVDGDTKGDILLS